MKALVMSHEKGGTYVLDRNGAYHFVHGYTRQAIGDEIDFSMQKPFAQRRIAALAATLLLCFFSASYIWLFRMDASYVHVDINPSVELVFNNMGFLKAAHALNEDAEALLASAHLTGTPRQVIVELLEAAARSGYDVHLQPENSDTYVRMTVTSRDEQKALRIFDDINTYLDQEHIHSVFLDTCTFDWYTDASNHGMSLNMIKLAHELIELDSSQSFEYLSLQSLQYIDKKIEEKKSDAEQYLQSLGRLLHVQEQTDDTSTDDPDVAGIEKETATLFVPPFNPISVTAEAVLPFNAENYGDEGEILDESTDDSLSLHDDASMMAELVTERDGKLSESANKVKPLALVSIRVLPFGQSDELGLGDSVDTWEADGDKNRQTASSSLDPSTLGNDKDAASASSAGEDAFSGKNENEKGQAEEQEHPEGNERPGGAAAGAVEDGTSQNNGQDGESENDGKSEERSDDEKKDDVGDDEEDDDDSTDSGNDKGNGSNANAGNGNSNGNGNNGSNPNANQGNNGNKGDGSNANAGSGNSNGNGNNGSNPNANQGNNGSNGNGSNANAGNGNSNGNGNNGSNPNANQGNNGNSSDVGSGE